jgi:hypothetical protein
MAFDRYPKVTNHSLTELLWSIHHATGSKGSSIKEVTALGKSGVNDFVTKALVFKRVTIGGGGVKNYPNLSDVIYGWPLKTVLILLNVLIEVSYKMFSKPTFTLAELMLVKLIFVEPMSNFKSLYLGSHNTSSQHH